MSMHGKRCDTRRGLAMAAWLVVGPASIVVAQVAPAPVATAPAPASAASPGTLHEAIAQRVQAEMTRRKIVGLSLAIARGDTIVHAASFGLADREKQIAASEQTMYRWASVSKPLTAVVSMQLVKEGRLDLDKDVRELVPEFPAKPHTITARQLLCHQGGIVHYGNGPVIRTERTYDDPNPFKSVILALDTFKESPLVCTPGEKHAYTTHGYILLSAVVERAAATRTTAADGTVTWTGPSFAELVRTRISEPLSITTLRPDYQWEDIPNRAIGYGGDGKGEPARSTDTDVSWKLGGGGFISTATDMARFGSGMLGTRLVDDTTREQMWTAQPTDSGEPTSYGLGFGVSNRDGRFFAHHSGSQEKASTFLLIDPAAAAGAGLVVAVMCNTEGRRLDALARDLCDLVNEPEPAAVPTKTETP